MIRTMADAVGANANLIPRSVDLVAGYVTGLPPVPWFDRDWAEFPGIPLVTIDQGAGANAPNYHADVIDIERGAWTVDHVTGWMDNALADRPVIYVNQGNEWGACRAALASPRYKGDVWLAFPGWQPGQPLPALPAGCHYTAIQNQLSVNNAYDLSAVIDDTWKGSIMPTIPGKWTQIISVEHQPSGDIILTGYALNNSPLPALYSLTWSAATATWGPPVLVGTFALGG